MFWLSLLAILEAMQLTVFLSLLLHFVPPPAPLAGSVYPEWQYLLKPEWETAIFRFFVFACIALMAIFIRAWHQRSSDKEFMSRLKCFVAVESVLVFFLLSALFKKTVYADRPALATTAFVLALVLACLNKIFWPFIYRSMRALWDFLTDGRNVPFLRSLLTVLMPLLIFLLIDVPNVPAVIARFFFGEQFHHNDSFIYGPAWAYLNGCVPNIDTISQYGAGLGVVLGSLMKLLGGFSYENGFLVMMYGTIIYYILCFIFLRRWLNSPVLATAGLLYMLKLQMFNTGVYPFVFTYGSATVMRYWFDILCMMAIAAHIQRPSPWFLAAAACACGAQLFYLPTEGVYLTAAYAAYMLIHLFRRSWREHIGFTLRRWPCWGILVVLPVIVALVLMRVLIGDAVMSASFWHNMGEFVEYFLSGFGMTPIYTGLVDKQYLASLMGFVVPCVYLLTLLVVGTLLFLGKIHRRHMLVVFLCLYGLGTYHYYIARSAVTSYYVVAIPYVMILCFWIKVILDRFELQTQRHFKMVILAVCVWALWTNHNFLSYPNRLNFSHNPLTDPLVAQPLDKDRPYFNHLFRDYNAQLKVPLNSLGESDEKFVRESDFPSDDSLVAYYDQEGDFSVDADLIDRLTSPKEAVPLISSFEIKMLMQAKRRPYFYYFPLVISHPMRARNFVTISIYTTDQLNKVLDGLRKDRPPYIFMEKIFLTTPVPRYFYFYYPSFMLLRDYVLDHYTPDDYGQYLVAMKRKE